MRLLRLSDYFEALRQLKDYYDWSIDGGAVRCRPKRSRAVGTIEPIVAIERVLTGNNRLRRHRGYIRSETFIPVEPNNMRCFVRACRRPGRRNHTPRERHARMVISKILGLAGEIA